MMVLEMANNMIDRIAQMLNRFCFSAHHDNDCNGCMFKAYKNCPIATLHDKIISKIT